MNDSVRRLYIVRHCQSEANAAQVLESTGDSPLTELGRSQARRVADVIAGFGLVETTLLASPRRRAAHTAEHIAAAIGCPARHDHRLCEGEVGEMEGLTLAEVQRRLREHGAEALTHEVHGGESFEEIGARLHTALEEHLATTRGPVVLVAHGYAITALLHRLCDGDPAARALAIGNGDIVAVNLRAGRADGAFTHQPLDA